MIAKLFNKINKSYKIHKLLDPLRTFKFQNKTFHYFCHDYNTTYLNERTVELPIIWSEVQRYSPKKILEIGNVLSHYFPTRHQVVDKYEVAPGVINADIVNFRSKKKFDLIVSISTLEHVGWDESPRNKQKILKAISTIKTLLSPQGVAFITLPLGYNTYLDDHLKNNAFHFDKVVFLQRTSAFNVWEEVDESIIKSQPQYNYPFQNANVILVGKYEAK